MFIKNQKTLLFRTHVLHSAQVYVERFTYYIILICIANLNLCKQTFMFYILKYEKIGEVGKTNKQTNYIFSQN